MVTCRNYFMTCNNKIMSLCNLGRPPQDAGLQNLIVNDTLRVNNLLKSVKGEVARLCTENVYVPSSVILTGSSRYIYGPGINGIYLFPSGRDTFQTGSGSNYSATLYNTMWTDEALIVEDFRATATGIGNLEPPADFTLNVRLIVAPSITDLNTPWPNGTELLTLTIPDVNTVPQSSINQSVPVTIPAESYVGIRLDSVQSYLDFDLTWTLKFQKTK